MKLIRRGLAVTMALLLTVSAQPMAAEKSAPKTLEEREIAEGVKKGKKATPSNARRAVTEPKEEVKFNTGSHVYSVVSEEDFSEYELGDAFFEKDGSYTINIPEPNPFFPYEVQFIHDGKTTRQWFMSPDDSVEVAGHTFYVSAYFDGTAVTQMSLNVGGDTVIAYPKKKEFTDEETEEAEPMSLLPLETRALDIDLSAYTPAELTMVSVHELFTGNELADGDKVIWTREYKDDYTISLSGDKLDLSHSTSNLSNVSWKMIVGDDNQLASDNIRYTVNVNVTPSKNWLIPTVYTQDSEGNRIKREVRLNEKYSTTSYQDYGDDERELHIIVSSEDEQWDKDVLAYIGLEINEDVFADTRYDYFKVYEGEFTSVSEAETGTDITEKLFGVDMTQEDAGYTLERYNSKWITIVTFDAEGNATGCLPFYLYLTSKYIGNSVNCYYLWDNSEIDENNIVDITRHSRKDGIHYVTYILYKGYAADKLYYLKMNYNKEIEESSSEVIAAYAGQYSSMQEAEKADAADIKEELFNSSGYGADYSNGVSFTIFAGEDKTNPEETYHYFVKAEEGSNEPENENQPQPPLDSSTYITFSGLNNRDGESVKTYIVGSDKDSYSENYITILINEEADLTDLAPVFWLSNKANLYADGSSTPEISGESYHDFSKGAVQYTVSAENGIDSRNIWLQVIKAGVGNGNLYINSLADDNANTRKEDGITYSTREIFLDGRYDYRHDILLINTGETSIPSISVDLVSDEVELDKYWTLNGEYELPDISNGETDSSWQYYGNLWNLAKLRLKPKEGVADGRDITGKLIIKSGENTLIALTLTGIVGDPSITTKEIPQVVKYVPYGTMIQNNNKYSWNRVSYEIEDGELPDGMELKENGELYGVPTETGDFTFTVYMENSYYDFSPSRRTFTLTIIENTDKNVESSTDQGYLLTQRIQNINLNTNTDQTMISEGIYDEFVDIFLDGEKLKKDEDYTSESGSTKITIRSETLKANNVPGKHTLGIEFRTGEAKTLKRAAQNYEVTTRNQSSSSSGSGSSSGGSSGGKRRKTDGTTTAATVTVPRDAKKGYINEQTGIILGEEEGYSKWQQDEMGRKLIYADGTAARGYLIELPDGTAAEQVIWEQVNGLWYAFGASGYAKTGWVYDYQLNCWYYATAEYGIYSGWYRDSQDNYAYYLEPVTGRIAVGWKCINDKWYYFNEISPISSWKFNAAAGQWVYDVLSTSKPYGSMYNNELTPDGYFVGADGVWDGLNKQ